MRLGFGQLGGRLPGINGLMMKRPRNDSQPSANGLQGQQQNLDAPKELGTSSSGCLNQLDTLASITNGENALTPLSYSLKNAQNNIRGDAQSNAEKLNICQKSSEV